MQPQHPSTRRDASSSADDLALHQAAGALDPVARAALGAAMQSGRLARSEVAQAWAAAGGAAPAFARWAAQRLAAFEARTVSATGPAPAPPDPAGAPRRIGPYAVERELARGGMGVVYVATHAQLGRRVALKLLPPGARAEEQERFQLEAQAAARLKHPNIVGVHDVGVERDQPWLAMDLIEGESLHARLARDGALPEEQAAAIVEKVARAMAYAHMAGLLHRDIKPHNVLLDREGEPFLADFGVAKDVRHGAKGVTVTGQVIGTPSYMPPEQAAGDLALVDRRSDVYSLGATLFHALTGELPFDGPTPVNVITKVLTSETPRPSSRRRGLDPDLETVVLHAMEKDPAQRYPTALALAEDLQRWREGAPIVARPVTRLERLWRRARRNRGVTAGAAGLTLAIVTVLAASNVRLERAREAAARAAVDAQEAARKEAQAKQAADALNAELRVLRHLDRGHALLGLGRFPEADGAFRDAEREAGELDGPKREALRGAAARGRSEARLEEGRRLGEGGDEQAALACTFAPDGQAVASFERDRVVVRALQGDRTLMWGMATPAGQARLAFTGEGEALVCAWTEHDMTTAWVAAWDVSSGTERWRRPAPGSTALAVDVRRGVVAVASLTGRLLFLDAESGAPLGRELRPQDRHREGEREIPHDAAIYGVGFLPDGNLLASYADGLLCAWEVPAGRYGGAYNVQRVLRALAIVPSGVLFDGIGLVLGDASGTVSVWDMSAAREEGPERRRLLRGQGGEMRDLAFHRGGEGQDPLIAVTSHDGTVWVWDARGRVRRRIHTGEYTLGCSFSPDGRAVAVVVDNGPRVWSTGPRRFDGGGPVAFTWSGDGLFVTRVLPGVGKGVDVVQHDLVGRARPRTLHVPSRHGGDAVDVHSMAAIPDGVVISVNEENERLTARELWTWRPATGAQPRIVGLPLPAASLAVTPDGAGVLHGAFVNVGLADDQAGGVALLPAQGGGEPRPFPWHVGTVSALQVIDGRRFLSASRDGSVALWDLQGGTPRLFEGMTGAPLSAALERAGRLPNVNLERQVRAAAFSPEKGLLVVGNARGELRVWREDGAPHEVHELRGHAHHILLATFLPGGDRLVTASADGVARVWDMELGAVLRTIQAPERSLDGAAVSRDGRRLALGCEGDVWVYELAE